MIDQSQPLSGVTKVYYFNRQFEEPPMIHISFDRVSDWTTIQMKKSKKSINLYKIKFSNCFKTEFVFCNEAKSKWDNPSQYCEETYKNGTNFNTHKNGVYVIFDHKVFKPRKQTIQKKDKWNQNNEFALLFVTDLDGTLLGNDEALAKFNQMWIENFFFLKQKYLLVYCTGKSKWGFHRLFQQTPLLLPDFLITATGGYIYDFGKQQLTTEKYFLSEPIKYVDEIEFFAYYEPFLTELEDYVEYKKDLNWNPKLLQEIISEQYKNRLTMNENDPSEDFTLRHKFKVEHLEYLLQNLDQLKKKIEKHNIKADVLIGGNGELRYMDLIPTQLDKGIAVNFLQQYLKLNQFTKSVGFGDSMNDLELLRDGVDQGIIVNNVSEELKMYYQQLENFIRWYLDNQHCQQHIKLALQPYAFAHIQYLQAWLNQEH